MTLNPAHVYRYIGLVSKLHHNTGLPHGESVAMPLRFQKGTEQFITFKLANAIFYFEKDTSQGGQLEIILRPGTYCMDEPDSLSRVVWTSPFIREEEWRSYSASFIPHIDSGFLVLRIIPTPSEAYKATPQNNPFNILIDQMSGPYNGVFRQPELGPDTTICRGDTLWVEGGSSPDFLTWNDGYPFPARPLTESGTYIATSSFGHFIFSDTVTLEVREPAFTGLGPDSVICKQSDFLLGPNRADYSWEWSDGINESPRRIYHSGTYILKGTNGACHVSDTVYYAVRSCESLIEMPNVFSPNGDGINDVFKPMLSKEVELFQIRIYDRWGREMVVLPDVLAGWDGQGPDSQPAAGGVYFWVVAYREHNGSEVKQMRGSVTLIR